MRAAQLTDMRVSTASFAWYQACTRECGNCKPETGCPFYKCMNLQATVYTHASISEASKILGDIVSFRTSPHLHRFCSRLRLAGRSWQSPDCCSRRRRCERASYAVMPPAHRHGAAALGPRQTCPQHMHRRRLRNDLSLRGHSQHHQQRLIGRQRAAEQGLSRNMGSHRREEAERAAAGHRAVPRRRHDPSRRYRCRAVWTDVAQCCAIRCGECAQLAVSKQQARSPCAFSLSQAGAVQGQSHARCITARL